jgi:hypothetical protein
VGKGTQDISIPKKPPSLLAHAWVNLKNFRHGDYGEKKKHFYAYKTIQPTVRPPMSNFVVMLSRAAASFLVRCS